MKNFLERLSQCQSGMNVSEFARFLSINQKTLDLYIKGERKPSVDLVVAVCSKCHVKADWLLGLSCGDDEKSEWETRAQNAERKLGKVSDALELILKATEKLRGAVK